MTLNEFRSNERLQAEAAALKNNPTFRLIIEALESEHPGKLPPAGTSIEDRAIHQAITQGYQRVLSSLNLVGKKLATTKESVVTNNYSAKPIAGIEPPKIPVDVPPPVESS